VLFTVFYRGHGLHESNGPYRRSDLRGDRDGEHKKVTSLGMQYVPMHWECSFPKDRIFAEFLELDLKECRHENLRSLSRW
jgi:hypothetical protein